MCRTSSFYLVLLAAASLLPPADAQFTQQGSKVIANDRIGSTIYQGDYVAVSADGNTAIVGGTGDSALGAAWIYTRNAGSWTEQAKLVGSGAKGNSTQGAAVAISADGNTALVGGNQDDTNRGALWIFTRRNGHWSQQGNKLVPAEAINGTAHCSSVGFAAALSADGNTAIAGGIACDSGPSIFIFVRSNGTWSGQAMLAGTGGSSSAQQGFAVALSADGNTALVGGPGGSTTGAAWVFTRSGAAWAQQGNPLIGAGGSGAQQQGFSVALSADGNTALIGGGGDSSNVGASWVFTRGSNGVWTQQGNKLTALENSGAAQQGYWVSLSGDGNTALVAGPADNLNAGAAWVYTPAASGAWTQQGAKLTLGGANPTPPTQQSISAMSLALSADASTAVIGSGNDNNFVGASWFFAQPRFVTLNHPGNLTQGQDTALYTIQTGGQAASNGAVTIDR